MEKRMNYFYCFVVSLALALGWQSLNAMAVSPRSPTADATDISLQVPPAPQNTPNVSPREDEKAEKTLVASLGIKEQQYLFMNRQRMLMKRGFTDDAQEKYPLHWAARCNDPEVLAKLLANGEYKYMVNERDAWGATPLYWAALVAEPEAWSSDKDGESLDDEKGCALDSDDEAEDKEAEIRYRQNNFRCFDLLFRAGASPNIRTHQAYGLLDDDDAHMYEVGGDSATHVLFALYNIGKIRYETWLGYLVRFINQQASFKITNPAGLTPIDLVAKEVRTYMRQLVEEKQAAFKREIDEEAARYQKAYLALCERFANVSLAATPARSTLCDKLDRALAAVSVVEVVE